MTTMIKYLLLFLMCCSYTQDTSLRHWLQSRTTNTILVPSMLCTHINILLRMR